MGCDIQVLSCCSAVENQAHCDFVKLRNMLIRTHMHDLKDVTCDVHYENYRAQCIQQMTRWVLAASARGGSLCGAAHQPGGCGFAGDVLGCGLGNGARKYSECKACGLSLWWGCFLSEDS